MPVSITVGGVDRTSQAHFQSLSVLNTAATKADTADLVFTTTGNWRPMAGNVVYVANGNSTEFGGVAMEITEELVNPSRMRYKVNCRDFVHLLDRTLIVENYASQSASAIVRDIVTNYTSGFTSSGVKNSSNVAAQTFNYRTVSDAIQNMADTLGWSWGVTYDRDVRFFSAAGVTAPVGTINLDTNTTDYGDCVLSESVQQVQNSIYLTGFSVKGTATYSPTFTGDGLTSFFNIGYEPGSTDATDISITRNGLPQTVNLDTVDGQAGDGVGGANDAFVCFDNLGIRYTVPPGVGDVIVPTMTTMHDAVINVQDTASQSTMAAREGGSGVHESMINDPGLKANDGTDALAIDRGNQALIRYAFPRFQGKFTSYTQGWKAGQSLVMTSTKRWGGGFSKTMYVSQVRKILINSGSTVGQTSTGPLLRYEIEVSDQGLGL